MTEELQNLVKIRVWLDQFASALGSAELALRTAAFCAEQHEGLAFLRNPIAEALGMLGEIDSKRSAERSVVREQLTELNWKAGASWKC